MSFHDKKLTRKRYGLDRDPVLDGIDALFAQAQGQPQPDAAVTGIRAMRLHNHDIRQKRAVQESGQRATTDKLTCLKNREGMEEHLHRFIEDIKRHPSKSVIVAFIDLDGFKALNDGCGHDVGDAALQEVARRLENTFRKTDVVCRPGGDELVILLPLEAGEGLSRTVIKAKVRQALQGMAAWNGDNKPFPIGASIGVHMIDGYTMDREIETEHIAQAALVLADTTMYLDKWHEGHKDSLPGGADDPGHPKNRRLQAARTQALANPEFTFGNN